MSVPNIDTFENDISTEIKQKEATIGDIASAGGDIGNSSEQQKQKISPVLFILISVVVLVAAGAILYFGYGYYTKNINTSVTSTPILKIPKTNDVTLLPKISPLFPDAFGRFITNVEKKPDGYILTFADTFTAYSSIFAYMIKNEGDYANDIAQAVGSPSDAGTTTPSFTFLDTTINNQNMRVGNSASSTIVYAFINTQALVISSSTEGIFLLRSDVTR